MSGEITDKDEIADKIEKLLPGTNLAQIEKEARKYVQDKLGIEDPDIDVPAFYSVMKICTIPNPNPSLGGAFSSEYASREDSVAICHGKAVDIVTYMLAFHERLQSEVGKADRDGNTDYTELFSVDNLVLKKLPYIEILPYGFCEDDFMNHHSHLVSRQNRMDKQKSDLSAQMDASVALIKIYDKYPK